MNPPPGPPRVLPVTPYPPTPPLGGGRRRQLELLRWLAERTKLTLATVVFGDEDAEALASLVPEGVRVLSGRPIRGVFTRRLPPALQWCWSARLAGQIADAHAADSFDAAVVSHSYAYLYAEDLQCLGSWTPRTSNPGCTSSSQRCRPPNVLRTAGWREGPG